MFMSLFLSSRRRHTRCALVTGVSDVCSSDLRSLAGTSHNGPTDSWWQDLGNRQLDALVSEALDNSPTIEQAAARIQMGIAQAERARAALMPSVDATATARYSRITQSIGLPTDGDWHWLMAGLVNLNYDLDLW